MANIIHFTPRAQLSARDNIAEFIRQCRDDLTVLGSQLPFDENTWDVSSHVQHKGRNIAVRVVFSSFEAAKNKRDSPAMAAGFIEFAKAYFRYVYALRPTKFIGNRLAALRLVDAALCEQGQAGTVAAISADVMNRACQLAIENYSESLAPKLAGELETLADFLLEKSMASLSTRWVKPIRKARELNMRVGKEADKAREKKMPSAAAIEAMAHVFKNASEPLEMYVGATLALLHCAPQRINETVRLAASCEVEQKDTAGSAQYGLRWPGSKGFDDQIKWILPSMADLARKAIGMLKDASEGARAIARWYEDHPGMIFLDPHIEHLRALQHLSPEQVSLVLFGDEDATKGKSWCARENVTRQGGVYLFADIEARVLAKLPRGFPFAQPGLKFSDALFAVRRFELDSKLSTYMCLFDYLSSDQIASRIGGSGSVKQTVFDRFRLTEDDGTRVCLTSHQVRHYLNTLAQANGASQLDIAMWSGRADVGQNQAYDHLTPAVINSKAITLASSESPLFGGDLNTPKVRVLARRDAEGQLTVGSAHISDYGMCVHDYAMSTCQVHRDCLNCNELVCIKGDDVKTERLRWRRDRIRQLLSKAEADAQESTYGAPRWVVHQRRTLEHCEQLLAILEDPKVIDGAVVRLEGVEPASRLAQAQAEREQKTASLPTRRNHLLERTKRGQGA